MGYFKSAGIDAEHWSSVGAEDAPDIEIMSYARENACIVLTHDLDFSTILAVTGGRKPSVIQLRSDDLRPDAIGPRTVSALRQLALELADGAVLTIDNVRVRLRQLPFSSTA